MKKTISIQISGILFHVDDDAYEKLDQYLRSIRNHFAHLADRDEIVSDIESRIAEKFSEKLKKNKQTIMLKDVEGLIESMGTVADFEEFETGNRTSEEDMYEEKPKQDERISHHPRRLYRDPDNKVFAGVASGLALYFGIDPVIVRVIFVVLALFHGLGIIAYIILWIAMPMARTHSQRMEMQGEPVTLSGLEENIHRDTRTFDVPTFTSIYTRGGIRLRIRKGKECSVAARGLSRDVRRVDIRVVDNELRIEREHGPWLGYIFHGFRQLSFDITLPHLSKVDVAGGCMVDVEGFKDDNETTLRAAGATRLRADVKVKTLRVHAEGASAVTIRGSGDTIFATAIGASNLDARGFHAKHAHVDVSGACAAKVDAADTIDGTVTGASSLKYAGSPTVTAKASGGSGISGKGKEEDAHDDWHDGWKDDDTDERDDRRASPRYDDRSPVEKFFVSIGNGLRAVLFAILRVVGVLIAIAAVVAIIGIVLSFLAVIRTGFIPFIGAHFFLGSPLSWLLLIIAFVIVMGPVLIVFHVGKALARLRSAISPGGFVAFVVVWFVLIFAVVSGLKIIRPELMPGPEPAATQTFAPGNFDSILATDADILHISQGSGYTVTASGPQDEMQNIHLLRDNGTLQIEHTGNNHRFCIFCHYHTVTFDIVMPRINNLTFGGLTRATVTDDSGTTLNLTTNGIANVMIDGSGRTLSLHASDLSRVDAANFIVEHADVSLRDLAHADLQVTGDIAGSTRDLSRLMYRGSPVMTVTSEGLSKVEPSLP
ncbi:MAG TPA: DUF2807 domain-containing protein [Candidatus Peribacteraceae bacterium]|nr:DUF2807 domain-containing protein [Candidatus Peribacteraceae bacterium]